MKRTDKFQVIVAWLAKEQLVGAETGSKKIDKCKNLANSIPVNNNKEGEEASNSSDEEQDNDSDSDNEELSDGNVVLQEIEDSSNEDEEESEEDYQNIEGNSGFYKHTRAGRPMTTYMTKQFLGDSE